MQIVSTALNCTEEVRMHLLCIIVSFQFVLVHVCVCGTEYSVAESRSHRYRATEVVITVQGPAILKTYF